MTEARKKNPKLSVIIPVGQRVDDVDVLVAEYIDAFETANADYEFIIVLDGPKKELLKALDSVMTVNSAFKVVELSKEFGESAALMAGFSEAQGEYLVTLPAYYQVNPLEIAKLLAAIDDDDDMLIAVRWPRAGSIFDKVRRSIFHGLLNYISRMKYRDLGCSVRLMRREVLTEVSLYGDQDRFLPALAARRGFRVREIELAQSPKDSFRGRYQLREYLRRFLDVLTIFFLIRFTKKPLRFFGTIGFLAAGVGGIFLAVLIVQRLIFNIPLADRPALILGSLLVVLGVQIFALGLIGELIIFSHASGMKEYAIRSVIQGSGTPEEQTLRL